ncbi:MAG TPA: sugar ABC transporter permease [bacterium]|nr:sugar ABC transporter permease [bacterium]
MVSAARGAVLRPPASRARSDRARAYLLLAPACALLLGLIAYPLLRAVWLSVHDVRLLQLGTATYVGGAQYVASWADPTFWIGVRQTVIWTVGVVGAQLVFGMCGALLLNKPFRGRAFWRGVALVPWASSSVLVALMWLWLLDSNYGVLNDVLRRLGLLHTAFAWLAEPRTALPAVMLAAIWQGTPFFAVMLLAGLQAIPEDLYEAARIDGGNAWAAFRYVTLPLLRPTILITTMLRTMWVANYMDLTFVMTGGGPGVATLTVPLYAYFAAYKRLAIGSGAAVAMQLAVVLAGAVLIYMRLLGSVEAAE